MCVYNVYTHIYPRNTFYTRLHKHNNNNRNDNYNNERQPNEKKRIEKIPIGKMMKIWSIFCCSDGDGR